MRHYLLHANESSWLSSIDQSLAALNKHFSDWHVRGLCMRTKTMPRKLTNGPTKHQPKTIQRKWNTLIQAQKMAHARTHTLARLTRRGKSNAAANTRHRLYEIWLIGYWLFYASKMAIQRECCSACSTIKTCILSTLFNYTMPENHRIGWPSQLTLDRPEPTEIFWQANVRISEWYSQSI